MPKIVSIHSGRGGTGKSNFTANLAAAIALTGRRVAVIDTGLQSPGIHMLFDLEENSIHKTLNDYLWGRCAIEDTACDVTSELGTGVDGQLFLIPVSVDADEIARILSEGYNVSFLNDGFHQVIQMLQLDYLLIDAHPGLSRETLLSIAISHLLLDKGGVNPITGNRAIDNHYVQDVLSVMLSCGMYDYSGEWLYRVGIPAKSGVGGGIVAIVPGRLGIGVFSPLLDAKGNSARGLKVCADLAKKFGMHVFNAAPPDQNLTEWVEGQL